MVVAIERVLWSCHTAVTSVEFIRCATWCRI